ncbi:MAG: hypothetical protein J1E85_07795 [Ruminococcus sp.]|nr:hypothetical protein [Ruminococcus sp.]
MMMQEPTEELIKEWKDIYYKNKDNLIPNKKEGLKIVEYLKDKYSVIEIENQKLEKAVYENITSNEYSNSKLNGKNPIIKLFEITDDRLYLTQNEVFKGIRIIVGIELNSSYIFVEGSSMLYDELLAFTGLDKEDLKNYFLVAQYIKCKEKFHI